MHPVFLLILRKKLTTQTHYSIIFNCIGTHKRLRLTRIRRYIDINPLFPITKILFTNERVGELMQKNL